MRAVLKILFVIFGTALLTLGIVWVLQGTGMVNWPSDGAMYGDNSWALYGGVAAAIGAGMLALARRFSGKQSVAGRR